MPSQTNFSLKKVSFFVSNTFYFIAYIIIQFFVTVGELIQGIFLLPFMFAGWLMRKFTSPRSGTAKINDYALPRRSIHSQHRKLHANNTVFFSLKRIFFGAAKIIRQILISIGKGCLVVMKASVYFIFNLIQRLVSFVIWIFFLPYRLFMALFSKEFRFFLLGFFICFVAVLLYQSYMFIVDLPSPRNIGKVNYPQSTHLYDRNGKILYEIYRDQNRTPVKIADLPAYIYQSTIAIEDKDFFRHNGVSLSSGILRAIRETIVTKSIQGGSTITQQLVKSALLTPERTFERKIKEIILALWTEKLYSKTQILEMYLNQVPYGGSSYGVQEAAKTFFGKDAKELNLEEAALLAGLPQAPSIYSPYVNPALAQARRNEVLKKMKEQGFITEQLMKEAISKPIQVQPLTTLIKAPHFVFYVKSNLEKKYGSSTVEQGGLNVITTIDVDIQAEAEKILREELEKIANLNVTNGAILVTKPSTGEILAMVGSRDYYEEPSGAFNVTTALRQPGSSIKPIMYSLALERGFTASTILDDSPASFAVPGGPAYQPVNYDGKFHGRVPLRYALANSFNVTAVRTLNTLGVNNFVDYARKLGITTWNDPSRFGLSLTLGGGEVHMTDMAVAFGVFANAGAKVKLSDVIRIKDTTDKLIYELQPEKKQVVDEGVAYIMSDILSDNFARRWEFGTNSALEIPGYKVAVKTGTTDEKKDNWTIGYTPQFLVAVWVGNNDNSPMNPYLASGITGAAPIWNRVMKYMLTKYGSNTWFEQPSNVVGKICYYGKTEYFIKGTETKSGCSEPFGTSPIVTPRP